MSTFKKSSNERSMALLLNQCTKRVPNRWAKEKGRPANPVRP
jgi:hypothetical protein